MEEVIAIMSFTLRLNAVMYPVTLTFVNRIVLFYFYIQENDWTLLQKCEIITKYLLAIPFALQLRIIIIALNCAES